MGLAPSGPPAAPAFKIGILPLLSYDPKLGRRQDKLSPQGAFCGAEDRKPGGASHAPCTYLPPFFFLAPGCATALASPALPDLGSNVTLVVQ